MNKESKQSKPIGRRIRDLRKEKGMNIRELSEKVGISRSYLSHIELESAQNPPIETVRKIAEALDTSISKLFGEEKEEKSSVSSSFNSPFTADELEEIASSEESFDEYMSVEGLNQESKQALHLFKEILNDPEIPIQKINNIRDEIVSHAKWLRAKAKNEVPAEGDEQ